MNVNEEVELKATFLSPVTPDDLMRSSLPYSYLEVEVRSTDNKTHDVQLYTDISAGESISWFGKDAANIGKNGYPATVDQLPSGPTVLWMKMSTLAAMLLLLQNSLRKISPRRHMGPRLHSTSQPRSFTYHGTLLKQAWIRFWNQRGILAQEQTSKVLEELHTTRCSDRNSSLTPRSINRQSMVTGTTPRKMLQA